MFTGAENPNGLGSRAVWPHDSSSRLRQHLPGPAARNPNLRTTLHAASGTGLHRGRNPQRRRHLLQWPLYALALALSLALLSFHCTSSPPTSLDAIYHSAEQHFVSGDLAAADAELSHLSTAQDPHDQNWPAKFRLLQAKVWVYQGRSPEALALLDSPSPPYNAAEAVTRDTLLALAYGRTGNLQKAQQLLSHAEHYFPDELSLAGVQLAQGIIYGEGARLPDSQQAFRLSLLGARHAGDRFLETQALLNLGVVALRQEHFDDALEQFAQASSVATAIGARQALEKATGNEGWAFYKLGDFQHALANSQFAAQQAAALGSTIDQVDFLNDAGLSQYRLGDLAKAKSSYQHSLQLARSIQNSEEIDESLVALASLALQTGDLRAALTQSQEAEQNASQGKDGSDPLQPALIEALALAAQGQTPSAKTQLLSLHQKSFPKPSVRWEVENALAKLSASTADPTSADAWFRRAIQTFQQQRYSVRHLDSKLPFAENGATLYLSYMHFLIDSGKFAEALAVLDQGRAETLAEGLAPASPNPHNPPRSPTEIARSLNATVLIYSLQTATSYLWAVTPSHVSFYRLPGRETLLPLIDAHTHAILSAKDLLAQPDAPARALYRALIEPAKDLIPPTGSVFIIADQDLDTLNFETLIPPAEPAHFWIEDTTIINARSLNLLASRQPAPQTLETAKRLLLVGAPDYTTLNYPPLPHAAEELSTVAAHFSPGHRLILSAAHATPAAYQLSRPGDYAYLHFVAHATGSESSPLDSAVILSPGTATDSYKLYARDILEQSLHADLVTISSCFGSGVRSYSGEGLVGLAWAFLRAGAHSVIGALWEVDDASTPRLMADLYDSLILGESPAAALRSAKLAMLHSTGIVRKPFYWASLQLYVGA